MYRCEMGKARGAVLPTRRSRRPPMKRHWSATWNWQRMERRAIGRVAIRASRSTAVPSLLQRRRRARWVRRVVVAAGVTGGGPGRGSGTRDRPDVHPWHSHGQTGSKCFRKPDNPRLREQQTQNATSTVGMSMRLYSSFALAQSGPAFICFHLEPYFGAFRRPGQIPDPHRPGLG